MRALGGRINQSIRARIETLGSSPPRTMPPAGQRGIWDIASDLERGAAAEAGGERGHSLYRCAFLVHGVLAEFDDVEALTDRARTILEPPKDYYALGLAARQRVLERYEKRHCIDLLTKFFQEVVDRRQAAT